ncbi:hypothetical protein Pmar_PMAR025848 [Perkinsus marinus ATCC 50983]|uniref:Reverse transcriptase domain-containing protein n=1 Tax=Perkinsus marinus (strain ATCC 50983 / TXsc) TaxID=423536 RepID=C5LUW0_PERM5|nr:hypothetical protein Pmar_PMAR025848 [Perkinsus marinus ATCC 50983]EEQ99460.1 hypothetical protein Pmar_PMAR025848 [Perkinsus marinus ATCC 50983]|eukprot:XP_002766743.1 hypothetical protein Pmar_PMAR025848 [Perkinsus marinus ATCC 50983]
MSSCIEDSEEYIPSYVARAVRSLELDAQEQFTDFRNGGMCALPGEEQPMSGQQVSFGKRLGKMLLEEGLKCNLKELVEKIDRKPTQEQADALEKAAEVAACNVRQALAAEFGSSILQRDKGNSIYCGLLSVITEQLELQDVDFPKICSQGLPLGIDVEIPHSSLYPRYKPKKQSLYEIPRVHSNYKSMLIPEVREKADCIVREEEAKGYIQRIDNSSLASGGRTYIRRAAVPKAGSYENGVRIVEDFKRSNTNLHSSIPNTARLPSVSHLRQLVGSLTAPHSQSTSSYKILQFDLKSAYRHLGIHPEERKNASFTHTFQDGNTVAYENMVLSFGHSAAAYWFVRYASLVLSCLELILRAMFSSTSSKPFACYMYVDDGFLCVRIEIYTEVAIIVIVFWLLLGSALSCNKLRCNSSDGTVVGIRVDTKDHPRFEIDPSKTGKLLEDLRKVVRAGRVSEQELSSLAGKLNRYASLRKYLKPYLQPFYGLLAVMRKVGRVTGSCPPGSEVHITARFFIKILTDPHAFHSVGPIRRSIDGFSGTLLLFTDASTRALGGVIALRDGCSDNFTKPEKSQRTIWFHKKNR